MRISALDLGIILLYLLGITLFGVRFRKRQRTLRDYFLGGRALPWWALALSIVATETSTLTVIGTPALAFAGNLGFLQLVLGYQVARVVICLLFIPQYFRGEFYTAYELIERRFGARLRSIAAGTFLLTRTMAEGVRVAAVALVVRVAFGTGELASVVIITLLTLLYTFHGGLTAVIWTDVIQLIIYLAGAVAAFFLLLQAIPGGWGEVAQVAAAHGKFQIFDFAWSLTQAYTFWAGIIGGTFLTTASHGTDQLMVQRLLAARSARDSRLALLASGVVIFAQFALFLVLGVMLYAHHGAPAIEPGRSYDWLLPEFIVTEMPAGLAGLMIAAVFAAAMSTTSGTLNSLASSTMVDLLGARRAADGAQESAFLARSRRITLAWGAVLLVLGTLEWGPLLEAGLSIASIVYGSLLGLFLLGILNRRATSHGALAGMIAGLAVMLYAKLATPLAWTWYVAVGTATTFAVGALSSLIGEKAGTTDEHR
jgi:SSS family transporter